MEENQIRHCSLCKRPNLSYKWINNNNNDFIELDCPVCGKYHIACDLISDLGLRGSRSRLEKLDEKEIISLRHYTKKSWNENLIAELSYSKLEQILSDHPYPSSLLDKINLVLEHIYRKTDFLYENIKFEPEINYSLFFCRDAGELRAILNHLREKKYIEFATFCENVTTNDFYQAYLLPEGIKHIEESGKNPKSDQCFVAMWFNDETENLWSKIKSLEKETGYTFYKIKITDKNNGWIPDTIIKEIKRSKFLIADLTGYRAGVYYEAGFAEGLGLEVIYTCNKKWFDEENEKMTIPVKCDDCQKDNSFKLDGVHFNLKQRKMILWENDNLNDFRTALSEKIGAVVGLNERAFNNGNKANKTS